MADSRGTPEMDEQRISMGRMIITNASIFVDSVKKWDRKPTAENT